MKEPIDAYVHTYLQILASTWRYFRGGRGNKESVSHIIDFACLDEAGAFAPSENNCYFNSIIFSDNSIPGPITKSHALLHHIRRSHPIVYRK